MDEAEVARAAALNRAFDAAHHRVMDGPRWYLPFMAVAPAQQGRGSGSALMRHTLDRVIPRGAPCYLDSVDERNLPFYEQLGFRIAETGMVPGSPLRTWALRRGCIGRADRSLFVVAETSHKGGLKRRSIKV